MQIDMQATLLLQAIVFLYTTTSKCSRKPISSSFSFWQMSFWVLVNISYAVVTAWSGGNTSGLYVHATNISVNTCISETGSSTKIAVVLFFAFEDFGILGEDSTNHSPPAIFFFFKRILVRAYQPHSLSQDQSTDAQLRRQWPSVRWRVACELVSLIGSHTRPGQHGQPILTLLGQGCASV